MFVYVISVMSDKFDLLCLQMCSSSSLFLFASKEQLIIIEDKIEKRLQRKKRQLNDIRYSMHKKIVHGHRTRTLTLKI